MDQLEILQLGSIPEWDLNALKEVYTVHTVPKGEDPIALVGDRADKIRGMSVGGAPVGRALMESFPNLGIVSVFGVGYDSVDVAAATDLKIRVTNTPDVLTEEVADFGFGMLIAAARNIVGGDAYVRSGRWGREGAMAFQKPVHGKKIGILGLGRIGKAVGRRCAACNMDIAYTNRSKRDDVDWRYEPDAVKLAEWSDYFMIVLPGGPETKHAVDKAVIEAVGPEGFLINISRGSTVDEEAMIQALQSGKLGFAALDVFENEPNIDPRFLTLDNVLLQPHQASATTETRQAMGKLMRDNLAAFFAGNDLLTPVA
ncbi:MAG: 2-hydroxyacid dehydrogenase [Pseudomonadota bacterium]